MSSECKAYLKLKLPKRVNTMRLSRETYELVACDYAFNQDINREGEVCSGLKGGIFSVSIIGKPTEELLAWMFDHIKRYNGEITILDGKYGTLEQVYFEEARCVDLTIQYKPEDKPCTITKLKIAAGEVRIGNAYFERMNQ